MLQRGSCIICMQCMHLQNFEEYPEHRTNFFLLLQAVNSHCFAGTVEVLFVIVFATPASFILIKLKV